VKEWIGTTTDEETIVTDKFVYTISVDDQKRVKEKKMTLNGRTLLHIRHSYDKQGNTSTQYEHHNLSEIQSISSLSLLNSINIGDDAWYSCQMNADGTRSLIFEILPEDSRKRIRLGEMRTKFTPSGLLLSSDITKYDEEDGSFKETEHVTINYNSTDSLSGEIIRKGTYPVYENKRLETRPRQKILFVKDSNGRYLHKEEMDYSGESKWTPDRKTNHQYDSNGFETLYEEYNYNSYQKVWEPRYYEQYIRDDRNRELSKTKKSWTGKEWINNTQTRSLHDDNHRRIMHESYQWKDNQWEGNEKDSTVFDPKGEPTIQFYFNWENDQWVYSWKKETTSSSPRHNNIQIEAEVRSIWKDNQWEVHYDRYQTRDYQADSTYYKVQRWDEDIEQLTVRTLERNYRQGNKRFYESYDWDYDRKLLAGEDKYITEIDTISRTALSTQYYDWDFNTHQWTPLFRKRFIVQEKAKKIDEYDSYDSEQKDWIAQTRIEEISSDSIFQEPKMQSMKLVSIADLESQYNDETDTITVTQTRWIRNHIKQEWQPQYQTINYTMRYSVIPLLTILNTYNTETAQWTPELMWKKRTDYEFVHQWNNLTLAWENHYKIEISHYLPALFYLWDTKTSQWKKKSLLNHENQQFSIALYARFSIDAEYDYKKRH